MKKKIMILGGSVLQLPGILQAKEMGLDVVVCDYYEDCPGKRVPGVIGELISTYDFDGVLEAAKRHKIDGITTLCTDYPARVVAYVAEQLHLPGIPLDAAIRATDKGLMRQCMKKNGIPCPKFEIVKSEDACVAAIQRFDGKCVIKAVDNSGSRGIEMIENPRDEEAVRAAYKYCIPFSRSGDIVVEEFMEGKEICVETLNFDGECYPIQITDQKAKEPPYFTDAGYNQPSLLDKKTQEAIRDVAIRANKALGNTTGSSCTEMIVTKDGPKVVEIGPRLAGDYMTSHLVPLSTGVNMVEGIIKIALGEKPNVTPLFSKGSASRYFLKPVVGKIIDIQGVAEAEAIPGVEFVHLMKNVGDMAVPLRDSNDRIAVVVAQGNTAEDAIRICETAIDKIQVIVEPTVEK